MASKNDVHPVVAFFAGLPIVALAAGLAAAGVWGIYVLGGWTVMRVFGERAAGASALIAGFIAAVVLAMVAIAVVLAAIELGGLAIKRGRKIVRGQRVVDSSTEG